MHLKTRNVNDAFHSIVSGLSVARRWLKSDLEHNLVQTGKHWQDFALSDSRNGKVLRYNDPLVITYQKPTERVLFNEARNCNPFFHLFEAIWMLAGSNVLAPLIYYNKGMANYSDDGKTSNGAYGYRWRNAELKRSRVEFFERKKVDQLDTLCEHLAKNRSSRRAVLQMWNIEDDLLKIGNVVIPNGSNQVEPTSKDTCCNLSVIFEIVETPDLEYEGAIVHKLNMTVFNRSNDLIWGTLGANYVHFTILQEYMAGRLGVDVGQYHQVSSNAHVYLDKFDSEKWLDSEEGCTEADYYSSNVAVLGKGENVQQFDTECQIFVESNGDSIQDRNYYDSEFLRTVVQPMCNAFKYHKNREYEKALELVTTVEDQAWKIAGTAWIKKRQSMWNTKQQTQSQE